MSSFIVSMTKHEELLKASIMCRNETNDLLTQVIAKAKDDGVLTMPVDDEVVCCFITSFFQTFIMRSLEDMYRTGGGNSILTVNFKKALDSLFIFLEPWIREAHPHKRRHHNA
jgi:hypothetical protein